MSARGLLVIVLLGLAIAAGVVAFGDRPDEAVLDVPGPRPIGGRVRVEVLNAGGVAGVARTATTTLREAGFDVVQFGNARDFGQDSSVVIDRVGRIEWAEAVANELGIPNVLTQPDPNLFVDVTVLLGRAWPDQGSEPLWSEPPQRAPWDPRGWVGR